MSFFVILCHKKQIFMIVYKDKIALCEKRRIFMVKRIVGLITCLVMAFAVGVTANAAENPSTDASSVIIDDNVTPNGVARTKYVNSTKQSLSISNGTATCKCEVVGYEDVTTKVKITMVLQKKGLLTWSDQQTWTKTVYSYKGSLSKTYSVDSGKYRIKATYEIFTNSDSETITKYSEEKSV